MTHQEFSHFLDTLRHLPLTDDQLSKLRRELESRPRPQSAVTAVETAFDRISRAGLIGCVEGVPGSPTDLATDPEHMRGFGRD